MKMKLIAPFKTDFNILQFKVMKNKTNYLKFWSSVQAAYLDDQTIRFTTPLHKKMVYENIQTDGNKLSPECFVLQRDPLMIEAMKQAKSEIDHALTEQISIDVSLADTVCHIYDNAVGVLVTSIHIQEKFNQEQVESCKLLFAAIQEYCNQYMERFIEVYYDCRIKDILTNMLNLDRPYGYLQRKMVHGQLLNHDNEKLQHTYFETNKPAEPYWVNRTLYLSREKELSLFMNHWLALGMESIQEIEQQLIEDSFYLGWGNNLAYEDCDQQMIAYGIESLVLCQYYNVVLDRLNQHISVLIGHIYATKASAKNMKEIESLLKINKENAELVFMQMKEQFIHLQGHRKKHFESLLKKWKLASLQESIEQKLQFGENKLQDMYRRSSKLNHTISESILFAIGGIALIDFFANVSQYARNMMANPDMTSKDDYRFGFVTIAESVSPNGMIWSGFIFFLIVFLIFIYVKRRS